MDCKKVWQEPAERMEEALLTSIRTPMQASRWSLHDIEETPSSSSAERREDALSRDNAKKRGRDWFIEREYISRRLVTTLKTKHQTQQDSPFSTIFPALSFPSCAQNATAEPAKSWSSEDTADLNTYEMESARPNKRFRKYCAKNPYAAQAAAASLLAGAAWLEAVQALAAVKAVASNCAAMRLTKSESADYPLSREGTS